MITKNTASLVGFFLVLVFAKMGLFCHQLYFRNLLHKYNNLHIFPFFFVFYFTPKRGCSSFTTLGHAGKEVGDCTKARGDKSPLPGTGNGCMLHDDVLFYWDHHCAILHQEVIRVICL